MKKLLITSGIVLVAAVAYGVLKPGDGMRPAHSTVTEKKSVAAKKKPVAAKKKARPKAERKLDALEEAEKMLARQGCKLLPLSLELEEGISVARYELPAPEPLAGFYLRHTAQRKGLLFQQADPRARKRADASRQAAAAQPASLPMDVPGVLSVYPTAIIRMAGDDGLCSAVASGKGWELFEVIPPEATAVPAAKPAQPPKPLPPGVLPPKPGEITPTADPNAIPPPPRHPIAVRTAIHEFEVADGFMRRELAQGDGWKIVSGQWQLNQHGGGLPANDAEAASMAFQRAANPFSVVGSAPPGTCATLAYDTPVAHGDSYVAEARFFFNATPNLAIPSSKNQPASTFLIAQGEIEGRQVGFGWSSSLSRWVLCTRTKKAPWQVLSTWSDRAPRLNWVRVGIAVLEGRIAVASLDDREVGRFALDGMVSGNFHVHTGNEGGKIEFDDVLAHPIVERRPDMGEPVFVKSRYFASKSSADRGHDPVEFDYWAKGTNTFIANADKDAILGLDVPRATARLPIYGDFTYRSMPELPVGEYRFIVLSKFPVQNAADRIAEVKFKKTDRGWVIPPDEQAEPVFMLEFGRRNGQFVLLSGKEPRLLGVAYPGPVHVMIVPPAGTNFAAEQHGLFSKSLYHALFEQAPTDWYWLDGQFGMSFRWSCQPGWNFMGGKSPELAATFSKAAYYGEQEVECYLALMMVLPAPQYYIRRDFGVSFCTDGRSLDSGYTLLFGGWNNTKTALFKRGKELASTNAAQFLFPVGTDHSQVHKLWWNFDLKRANKRLVVKLNGNALFDVDDPDPIDGGHVAFWTIGNGFVVSRANIVAEKRELHPEKGVFTFPEDENAWAATRPDGVIVRPDKQGAYVENPIGGGSFAVRTKCDVDLSKTPALELPLQLDDDAKVNLHIEIDGRPWLVKITAPVELMDWLLGPASDAAFPFGRPAIQGPALDGILIGEAKPQAGVLRVDVGGLLKKKGANYAGVRPVFLTIGNSSNAGYLLAGFGGNHAGTKYWVGPPRWSEAAK